MNEEASIKFSQLEQRLSQLVNEHRALKAQTAVLEGEKSELEKTIEAQKEELKSFQNQDKISKIVQNVVSGETVEEGKFTELKLTINEYIKEIDKCITQLSNS